MLAGVAVIARPVISAALTVVVSHKISRVVLFHFAQQDCQEQAIAGDVVTPDADHQVLTPGADPRQQLLRSLTQSPKALWSSV